MGQIRIGRALFTVLDFDKRKRGDLILMRAKHRPRSGISTSSSAPGATTMSSGRLSFTRDGNGMSEFCAVSRVREATSLRLCAWELDSGVARTKSLGAFSQLAAR